MYNKTKALFIVCLFILTINHAQDLSSQIDTYLASVYSSNEPGVSILVAKNGKSIYRKAFGKANLELDVPLKSENIFEIGSITKQFTAVSILMLEEQGKLNLTDEITKFIPDYPTHNKTITIHHLLNHTSGIKSYTSMSSFISKARTDMKPTELIDVFKNEPMDFDPGEKFLYNNSGYILLGYIIEVITGDTYENFIENNIFKRIGMTSSFYGSKKELILNRASGYQKQSNYVNADYLSMSLPYAAGSIMSTVDDLLKWQNAISANTFISRISLEKAINGSVLNNGEKIPYGYGWFKGIINGSTAIAHSGGIFGYTTNGIYLPKEDIYVIALSNCNCKNVSFVAKKIAAMAIGKPYPEIKDAISLSKDKLQKWVGTYEFDNNTIRYISLEDGQLNSLRENSKYKIYPITDSYFIFEDVTISYQFSLQSNGKKQVIFKNDNETSIGKEIDKDPPAEKKELQLSPTILKQYIGKYELQPGFIIEITVDDTKIFEQATGQPKFEIFAEKEDSFFLKVVSASIIFSKDDNGKITSLTLNQGGKKMIGKKVE